MVTDRAISNFCAGDVISAVAVANQITSGKSVFAWLGEALLCRDQYDFALSAFQEGLQVNPDDVDCLVGIIDTNDSITVANAFRVADMWAVLAKDPNMRELLRAPKFKALIQVVRDKPSQYKHHSADLAIDGRTAPTEATGETSPSLTLQPTPPSSPPKAASNPQIPATSTEVATWGQGPPREVSVAEVQQWTDNFSPARKIGEGAFGDVFEGQCQSIPVAVKRLKPTLRLQGDEETDRAVLSTIRREIYVLSKFHHPHIIRLLGFTSVASVAQELCLVYELGPLGSMDQSLVDDARASDLTWKVRVRIAAAVARAINYLHCHDEKSPTFHRDIKSANIVLFHGFVPKLIDCGLSKFIPDPATTHHLGSIMSTKGMALGTPGYMCPTYIRKLQYDAKSEIYSFGIVLLELLTGRLMSSRRDGQDLYDEYIEDMTPIGPDLDARAGPWSVECAQRLEALARECLAPYKTRVSSMLTVLRRLVELEKTYCAATPEEIRMTQLVEDLQRQVDALRSSPKQPAEILRMCNICFDQSANGLGCGAGDVLHFICADCAPQEVQRILNEIEAEATQLARHRAQGGRIQCVMPGCDAVYSEQALAKVLPDAIFGHYRAAQDAVVEQRQYTYHQERFQLELEAARAEFKRSNDLARTRQDAAATAEFMRRQFPNAVQCPRCGAGPVIPENCYNLKTHHGESTSGGGRISNACPSCQFFTPERSVWANWDGQMR
ncbi:TKL protein kinase [Aphanomyces astaci]|uniref:TKL protein kinase n=1 Tax=Aphanomyces astaci TaxID=112090 RepID=W4GMX1_APHAT|nr:TKL protein kinase [Aphanomyces astaci]ETV81027.1 TKL protein kinase [Aphanomyces astaci]|eukprot:XP_009828885.1 TKL protein kinase [Aphanomyces astaci]